MNFTYLKNRVMDSGLCISCGTCAGICPLFSIEINEIGLPRFLGKCNNCGLCINFCPVTDFNFNKFYQKIFDRKVNYDSFIGGCRNIYFGRSLDEEIWRKASGGGIIPALLISALEKGMIDGAIVAKMDEKNVGKTRILLAKNKEEVLKSTQSKYVPCPVGMILKEVKREKGTYAFVGLPCHVHSLRKLQEDGPGWCSKKIRYLIGLFCGQSMRGTFIDYVLSFFNLKKSEIKEISFRHKRPPNRSSLLIATKDGREFSIDKREYSFLFYLFINNGCLYCIDHTNEFADISVGDMKPFSRSSPNYRAIEPFLSVVIIRTKKGVELFESAKNIKFYNYDTQDLIHSKIVNMIDKKICAHARIELRRRRGLFAPNFHEHVMKDYNLSHYGLTIRPSKAFTTNRFLYELLWIKTVELMQGTGVSIILSKLPMWLLRVVVSTGFIRFKTSKIINENA